MLNCLTSPCHIEHNCTIWYLNSPIHRYAVTTIQLDTTSVFEFAPIRVSVSNTSQHKYRPCPNLARRQEHLLGPPLTLSYISLLALMLVLGLTVLRPKKLVHYIPHLRSITFPFYYHSILLHSTSSIPIPH